jgi:beta-phosphoglucomutase-like phosphatase (HAD superfamily)
LQRRIKSRCGHRFLITAEQAEAYKPSRAIFKHAYRELGTTKDDVVHICASPHLDLAAARDIGFRCIWIDRGTGRKPWPTIRPTGPSRRSTKCRRSSPRSVGVIDRILAKQSAFRTTVTF